MDYFFENLGDEKFQQLCHSIINKEFPHSQAFPVGQRDGGRDSIVYYLGSKHKEFIVFQVKYVRNPQSITDVHKWFTDIIKDEIEKIKKLIPNGAKEYFLLTNVKGTAYLNSGSIDKLNDILKEHMPIPSFCWWRDDLCGKLDGMIDLKWSYPEILNGQDILSSYVFNNINENKERREGALSTYLIDQYDIDNEVKFKQIELQNNLFDLFVDVPIRLKNLDNDKYAFLQEKLRRIHRLQKEEIKISVEKNNIDTQESNDIGAAYFLLNHISQSELNKILIEGGPGQGKSTITQFVCQIHRIKLLNKKNELNNLPEYLQTIPVRIPFKIDLRDLATWITKKNPYSSATSDETFNKIWNKSLESFLIWHISYHSKRYDFSIDDLMSITKYSSVLFVFDGFDEIADFKIREEIIELINKGLQRLQQISTSIQVIITSRPAAFANSIGFATEAYPHFELGDINPTFINQYVEKWIGSRKLKDREANEIRKIVSDKLDLPHLRDLAKSPMQLAILISLLNTRGESLPNKRTALYDSYINLFFDRESEKNAYIRDQRDLIINLHQYIAWILHSEAELNNGTGRIDLKQLISKLKDYLESEGHPTDIADRLFTVMQERVCALVSRVQGTFEFEVQPLREFFCAKHLYNTSPYSPAGASKKGTLPDRFDALASNFYWQNVVRFFAGCFDRGELPMLILKLKELQDHEHLKYTNYPRILTAQLLSDWVFTQFPKLLQDVVEIIINGVNIGIVVNQNRHFRKNEYIVLPQECGRKELVIDCFNELKKTPPEDYARELVDIINNNPYPQDIWENHCFELSGKELTQWLYYGYYLRIIHQITTQTLLKILSIDNIIDSKRLEILINSGRIDILNENHNFKEKALESILNHEGFFIPRKNKNSSLSPLSIMLNANQLSWMSVSENYMNDNFKQFLVHQIYLNNDDDDTEHFFFVTNSKDAIDEKIRTYFERLNDVFQSNIAEWRDSLKYWEILVEEGIVIFGRKWCFNIIAVVAAGIKSSNEKSEEYFNLDDDSVSLCKRVRHARLKSGNISWWTNQIDNTTNITFTLLVFFTWATPRSIITLSNILSDKLIQLKDSELEKLFSSLKRISIVSKYNSTQEKYLMNNLTNGSSDILKYIISIRFQNKQYDYIKGFLKNYDGDTKDILDVKLDFLIRKFLEESSDENTLEQIRQTYLKTCGFNDGFYMHRDNRTNMHTNITPEIAIKIMADCKMYPRYLVYKAEQICRSLANEKIRAVGNIAINEEWFT